MALDYTITFNGVTVGNGTTVQILSADGFEDLPDVRSDDVPFGFNWGELPGNDYAAGRTITLQLLILDNGAGDYFTRVESIKAMSIVGTESTMLFQLPGRTQRLITCRVRRRVIPINADYQFRYGVCTIEFHATDPRIYDAVLQQASLTVFVAGSLAIDYTVGAGADLAFDYTVGAGADLAFDYTGIASTGLQTITNLGYVDTYPIFVFSPATGISSFSVTNQTTGQVLTINQTVNPGQTLIANMQIAATGTSSGAAGLPISIGGTSVYGSWVPPRTPFRLIPGANVLRFDMATGDPAATALVTAPSAYL